MSKTEQFLSEIQDLCVRHKGSIRALGRMLVEVEGQEPVLVFTIEAGVIDLVWKEPVCQPK